MMEKIIIYDGPLKQVSLICRFVQIISKAVNKHGELIFNNKIKEIQRTMQFIKMRMKYHDYFLSTVAVTDLYTLRKIMRIYAPVGYVLVEDCDWDSKETDIDIKYYFKRVTT